MDGKRGKMDAKHTSERARLCHAPRTGSRQIDPPHSPLMACTLPLSPVHLGRVWHHVLPDPAVSKDGPVPCDGFCLVKMTLARPTRTQDFQSCRRTS